MLEQVREAREIVVRVCRMRVFPPFDRCIHNGASGHIKDTKDRLKQNKKIQSAKIAANYAVTSQSDQAQRSYLI